MPARTLRLVLAYEGTAYAGWQIQPEMPTVQGLLLAAARPLLGSDVRVTGASRTDAGVHALRQTVSVDTNRALPPDAVRRALNASLPRDIRVVTCDEAPPGFDARRAARASGTAIYCRPPRWPPRSCSVMPGMFPSPWTSP